MKRALAFIFSLFLCLSILPVPNAVVLAAGGSAPAAVSGLQITTAKKAKLLKLTWKQQDAADGYQIYRSTSGKTGSFQKIATVGTQTSYVDKHLKSATTYYYKVRAFSKQSGKAVFGPFAKAHLSTKITASFVKKKFNATVKFLDAFYSTGTDFDRMVLRPHTDAYGTYDDPHYRFSYKGCRTKAQLKQHLTKYVSGTVADAILAEKFMMIDGKLYIWFPPLGAEAAMDLAKTKVSDLHCADRKATVQIGAFWKGAAGYDEADYDFFNQTAGCSAGKPI